MSESFPTDAAVDRMVEPFMEAAGIEPARHSPRHESVIYAIQAGHGGPIKIGFCTSSETVRQRLRSLQTGNPYPLRVVYMVPGTREQEAEIHREFHSYRLAGEWFQPVRDLAKRLNARPGGDGIDIDWYYDQGFEAGWEVGFDDGHACEKCGFAACDCPSTPEEDKRFERHERRLEQQRDEVLHGSIRKLHAGVLGWL